MPATSPTCKLYPKYGVRVRLGETKTVIASGAGDVLVTVAAPGAAVGATSIPVDPLPESINPSRYLDFSGGRTCKLANVSNVAGQVNLTPLAPLAFALSAGETTILSGPIFLASISPFTSSDPSVAALSPFLTGLNDDNTGNQPPPVNLRTVTGVAVGTAVINASYNGAAATPITVTVDDPAAAPTAVISESSQTVRTNQAFEFTAEASTGVNKAVWDWDDGDLTRGKDMLSACHSYKAAGTYTVTLTITNSAGITATATRTVTVIDWPAPTYTVTGITTVAGLLAAYNAWDGASEGEIVCTAGIIADGELVIPAKASVTGWITIRTSGTLPSIGTRIAPSDAAQCFTIRSTSNGAIPCVLDKNTSNIRFMGIRFEPKYVVEGSGFPASYYLLQIGRTEIPALTESESPVNIVVDRCLMNPPDDVEVYHGLLNDGYKVAVADCWFGNIKSFGAQDSQAALSLSGPGCHVYLNCFLEGSAENMIYGGGVPSIDGLVMKNVEIRRCYMPKRLAWQPRQEINAKNLFEIKNGRRMYVEGCIFENHWDSGRSQFYALVLKTSTAPGGENEYVPYGTCEDVRIENCKFLNIYGGISTNNDMNYPGFGLKQSVLELQNLLFTLYAANSILGSLNIKFLQPSAADDFRMSHVTAIRTEPAGSGRGIYFANTNNYRFRIEDCIIGLGEQYSIIGSATFQGLQSINYGTGGTAGSSSSKDADALWTINKNVFYTPLGSNNMPVSLPGNANSFVADIPAVGFTDAAGGNYSLAAASPYKNTATDGTDPGIDKAALDSRTGSTVSGSGWTGAGGAGGRTRKYWDGTVIVD